jgi:TIR domain
MSGVFISYRRDDTSGQSDHLAADLTRELGRSEVFIDIDAIAPGVDFAEHIDSSLKTCDVVLVMIGKNWLSIKDAQGRRRIELEDDFVRMEVAKALARTDVRVVPVLVEGAQMPSAAELPPDLARLARINALLLSSTRWRYDVDQIVGLVTAGSVRGAVRRIPPVIKFGVPAAALAAAIAVVVALVTGGGDGGAGVNPKRLVLSPATVPPVRDECSQQLERAVDGTVGPLSCAGGEINQLAWQRYAPSLTLALGPNADPIQVGHALCDDLNSDVAGTFPTVGQIYDLGKLYYGWNFGIDPRPEGAGGIGRC